MKVSVIIPVYNAEAHLPACIASMRAQSLTACEFLFVNDGSTDGSLRLLEAAREADARVNVIDRPNGGTVVNG